MKELAYIFLHYYFYDIFLYQKKNILTIVIDAQISSPFSLNFNGYLKLDKFIDTFFHVKITKK